MHDRNKPDRKNFHDRARCTLECRLVLGDCFLVVLCLVVIQDPMAAMLVPTGWKTLVAHDFLLFLRRRAFFAFGQISYAVITKTDSGTGSGT
jgi:uncharacterized protein YjeT (DUF2065 family)